MQKGKLDTARRMLQRGVTIELIMDFTGLSYEEIKKEEER